MTRHGTNCSRLPAYAAADAYAYAFTAAAAREKLRPVVEKLQRSAVALLERMCEVTAQEGE